jgi:protein-S-isoprenylcysteine O-methyltransferase Ste14
MDAGPVSLPGLPASIAVFCRREGRSMNPLIPPPGVVALIGGLMWAVARTLETGKFAFAWQAAVAGVLLTTGLLLMLGAAAAFFAVRTTINPLRPARASSLVTTGLFRLSRNPIYLGDLLVLAAWGVWLGSLANVALLGVFVWYMNRFQILAEERALSRLFGERYTAYCASVRRWL